MDRKKKSKPKLHSQKTRVETKNRNADAFGRYSEGPTAFCGVGEDGHRKTMNT